MFHWTQRVRHRLRWRKVTMAALEVVQRREGFVARAWTALWKTTLPGFAKADRAQGLRRVETALQALPLADYPRANQLEVYLIDLGDIFKQAFDHIEGT